MAAPAFLPSVVRYCMTQMFSWIALRPLSSVTRKKMPAHSVSESAPFSHHHGLNKLIDDVTQGEIDEPVLGHPRKWGTAAYGIPQMAISNIYVRRTDNRGRAVFFVRGVQGWVPGCAHRSAFTGTHTSEGTCVGAVDIPFCQERPALEESGRVVTSGCAAARSGGVVNKAPA